MNHCSFVRLTHGAQIPLELVGPKRGRPVSRNAYAIFFYLISRALIRLVHEILYKEEEGNWTFSLLKASAVAFGLGFIHLSNKGAIVDGVGSAKAKKQILSDYSRMEIQDGRVLSNGLLSGIGCIPLEKRSACD